MDWYCIVNGSQQGPMDSSEVVALLRDGRLTPQDYVWTPAFGDQWRRAADVPEFAVPPPMASAPVASEPVAQTPLTGVPGNRPFFRAAVGHAWDRMVSVLFRPFDLARWFSIGFCAWIATLANGGIDIPSKGLDLKSFQANPTLDNLREALLQSYRGSLNELSQTGISLVAVLALFGALMFLWGLIACWLRSRGAFMLIHRWHHPNATVKESWAVGSGLGQSLFAFRVAFGMLMFVFTALVCAGAAFTVVLPLIHGSRFTENLQLISLGWLTAILTLLAVWTTVAMLLNQFVVPIMYWRRVRVLTAWRPVLALCNERPAAIVIFLSLYPLLSAGAALAALLLGCGTCGIGCCLMILPYLGAVLLLPRDFFLRGIGIHILRQWRPDLAGPHAEDAS